MEQLVFGNKQEAVNYKTKKGVYAVIFSPSMEMVLTVETTRGHYFLPGGGIEGTETSDECLRRELIEETGYEVFIVDIIGKAKRYFQSTKNEYIRNDGTFYLAKLTNMLKPPIEENHLIKWIPVENVEKALVHEHHIWAVKEGNKRMKDTSKNL
jgi:8-oxo-dGTP diphosphatase